MVHNALLSERRARVILDYFVAQGIDSQRIDIDWKGELDPAVPEPDETDEPANRRVTIILDQ